MPFLTVAGQEKIARQQGNKRVLRITHFVLANVPGLGNEPTDGITAMPANSQIVDTRTVTRSGYVNANQVVYSLSLDSTVGDYEFNWLGLKDEDDVLIAVTHIKQAIVKFATKGGVDGNNLVRNFLIAYSGIQAITAINAPAHTWQIDFTTRLIQIDERERLSNFDIYGNASFLDNGWQVQHDSNNQYRLLAGIGYVGGIRITSDTAQLFTATPGSSVWLDVSLQGDINGVTAVVDIIADSVDHHDYTDSLGFNHYLTKIAEISTGGNIEDQRVNADQIDDHEAKLDPHPQYSAKNHHHDDRYARTSHHHDDRYAPTSHHHDDRYATKSHHHNSQYMPIDAGPRSVYVDVTATGNTTSASTALTWALQVYSTVTFKVADMIMARYKSTETYGTGNGSATRTNYHIATFTRNNAGWQLIATR